MPTVMLVDYTGRGFDEPADYAARLLVTTKMTRLNTEAAFKEVDEMSSDELLKQLEYMASTIPSSWEFLDLTFLVIGVTRACAQQMTRTRTGSYAMQSQRVTNASKMAIKNPIEELDENGHPVEAFSIFEQAKISARLAYEELEAAGATPQDARGIMPINTTCNIFCKYNFRSFVDLVKARRSNRTQDEYRKIIELMYRKVVSIWPWVPLFFKNETQAAIDLIQKAIDEIGLETGSGIGWDLAKAQDLLRKL